MDVASLAAYRLTRYCQSNINKGRRQAGMNKTSPWMVLAGTLAGAQFAAAQQAACPVERHTVYVRKGVNDNPQTLVTNLSTPNTTVLLAADVDISFDDPALCKDGRPLLRFAHCVTLGSYLPDTGPISTTGSRDQPRPPPRRPTRGTAPCRS